MNKSIIKLISHPHAIETMQSRREYAHITGQEIVENAYWFENTETGQTYYKLFACIGYPPEISDKSHQEVGYVGIIGIIKKEGIDPRDAYFQLLDERVSTDVAILYNYCLDLREKYGYYSHPELLKSWYGDAERFQTTLALKNKRLKETESLSVTPPDDFYLPKIFDQYVRSLGSCIIGQPPRLYFGKNRLLKNKLKEFQYNDPCVIAAGGLVHTLLSRSMWMGNSEKSVFSVGEDE